MRKIRLSFGIILLCLVAKSQTPYSCYFEGVKVSFTLDTEHAFLSVKNQQLPDSIRQRNIRATTFRSDNSDKFLNQDFHKIKKISKIYFANPENLVRIVVQNKIKNCTFAKSFNNKLKSFLS